MEEAEKSNKETTFTATQKNKKRAISRKSTLLGAGLFIILIGIGFVVIHLTTLRYKIADPIGNISDWSRVEFASSDIEKANAHLSLAESKTSELKKQQASHHSTPPAKLINSILAHDRAAMVYMDKAKTEGNDIKGLNLVKRLCDSLEAQHQVLQSSSTYVAQKIGAMNKYTEAVESQVAQGHDLTNAIYEVNNSLGQAMGWQ